ncbi:phosphoglycolate phosphatase [Flavobacterium branchiophilum NBRC 15030 = ATCC 35035]|nr:phosphoglycolate phosphatase [Flavobacterium branchiophilum NBRC 15030 = ATCC 35035]
MPIHQFEHLSFDLWLTLIRSNPEFKAKRNQLFLDFFEIKASFETVSKIIRYYDVLCNTMNEKTGLNIDTFEIYYLILNALQVDISAISIEKLNLFYSETEKLFMQYKPVLIYPKLKQQFNVWSKEHKTINILSNTGFIKGKTLRKLLNYYELDTYISFQIYSDEEKFSKPNFIIFDKVFCQVNQIKSLQKNQIVHIGDNPLADYQGAASFGFKAILI